ncbi:MAG: hypothetical protein CL878_03585 [Dehalococcoidia bacterium]|nr:hypothetical protein [Dehalococcoidia bacterium]
MATAFVPPLPVLDAVIAVQQGKRQLALCIAISTWIDAGHMILPAAGYLGGLVSFEQTLRGLGLPGAIQVRPVEVQCSEGAYQRG